MKTEKLTDQKMKLFNRYFVSIIIMALFFDVCTRSLMGVFALHVDSLGGTATMAGLMTTLFTILAAVFRTVGGRFSDSHGRKMTILIGAAGIATTTILLSLTVNLYIILIIRAAQGLFFAVGSAGFSIAVSDVIPENRMSEGLGYFGMSSTLATAFGPMFALFIFGIYGFNSVAYVSAALCLTSLTITFFTCNYEKNPKYMKIGQTMKTDPAEPGDESDAPVAPAEPAAPAAPAVPAGQKKQEKTSVIDFIVEKKALPSGISVFFCTMAGGSAMGFLALYAQRLEFGNAGLFFLLQSGAAFLARIFSGRLSDKRGPLFSIIPGAFAGMLGYSILVLAGHSGIHFLFYLAGPLCGLGTGMIIPTLTATSIRNVPIQRRGAAMGTFYTMIEISLAVGAILWGTLIDHVSFYAVYLIAACCSLISGLLASCFFNNKKLRGNDNEQQRM